MIELKEYSYEHYLALYEALGGHTSHFLPVVGHQTYALGKLSMIEFNQAKEELLEILSHDDDWLIEHHPDDYIDYTETEMWEVTGLRQKLFVIELERFNRIYEALSKVNGEGVE